MTRKKSKIKYFVTFKNENNNTDTLSFNHLRDTEIGARPFARKHNRAGTLIRLSNSRGTKLNL